MKIIAEKNRNISEKKGVLYRITHEDGKFTLHMIPYGVGKNLNGVDVKIPYFADTTEKVIFEGEMSVVMKNKLELLLEDIVFVDAATQE